MIYFLLGKDDFSKREFLDELRVKEKLDVLDFHPDNSSTRGSSYSEQTAANIIDAANLQSLFSTKKLIRIHEAGGLDDLAKAIDRLKDSPNTIVFLLDSLDRRKTENKKLLERKEIKAKEFEIPAGPDFKKWIQQRAEKHAVVFGPGALDYFLERLGIGQDNFGEQIYDLWQADLELRKLGVFAKGEITGLTTQNITDLVSENLSENVFRITNAIADGNKKQATEYLTEYFDRLAGVDEKGKVISLSAILAEQFRGILAIQDMLQSRATDQEIAKKASFSPGRVFIYKKLANRFSQKKVQDCLRKLEFLDEETKTSSGPAGLQFLLIINGLMA